MKKLAIALFALSMTMGCSKSLADQLCEAQGDCDEDFDVDGCKEDAAEAEEDAEDVDCESEGEDYYQCGLDNGSCEEAGDVKFFQMDFDSCDSEEEAVSDCLADA